MEAESLGDEPPLNPPGVPSDLGALTAADDVDMRLADLFPLEVFGEAEDSNKKRKVFDGDV